jgi:hypothetical protein
MICSLVLNSVKRQEDRRGCECFRSLFFVVGWQIFTNKKSREEDSFILSSISPLLLSWWISSRRCETKDGDTRKWGGDNKFAAFFIGEDRPLGQALKSLIL